MFFFYFWPIFNFSHHYFNFFNKILSGFKKYVQLSLAFFLLEILYWNRVPYSQSKVIFQFSVKCEKNHAWFQNPW